MRTKTIVLQTLLQTAAVLLAAVVLSLGFSACSDNDDDVKPTLENKTVAGLIGTWYTSYAQKGTVAMASGQTARYIKVARALTFNSDGTGTCWHFCCDILGDPVSLYGGAGDAVNGRFHWTVGQDSIVTVTRDGDGNAENPKTWTLSIGNDGLTGNDGTTDFLLGSADSDWQAYIASLEEDYRSGGNADEEPNFLTDWQDCKMVRIEGLTAKQYTPWAGSQDSDIADEIRFDVQKEAGWEMAFCVLNDPAGKNTRFFALYNRFTGTLRVFNYVLNPGSQGYGREMGYMFLADGDVRMPRYPFYNSMEYAIPVCHNYADAATFDRYAQLSTNGSSYKPFESMFSAYTRNTLAFGVSAGWHCTDFDFSGYQEGGVQWTKNAQDEGTLLSVRPYSQDESEVLLTGTIIGEMKGEYTDPTYSTKTTGSPVVSALNGIVGSLSGLSTGLYSSANTMYSLYSREYAIAEFGVNAIGNWCVGSGILQIASCGLKIIDQFAGGKQQSVPKSPGTINMTLDAKVDLTGIIKSWKTVDDAGVRVTPNLQLTDSVGKAQGNVYFTPGSGTSVAEVTASNETQLKHFSRITFLHNSAWPYNESVYQKYTEGDIITYTPTITWEDVWGNEYSSLKDNDLTLKWVCIRQGSQGVKPMFCAITNSTYNAMNGHMQDNSYCPGESKAKSISKTLKASWDFYVERFNAAGCGKLSTSQKYWIDYQSWYYYVINYKTGEMSSGGGARDVYFPVLLKIDWLDDNAIRNFLIGTDGCAGHGGEGYVRLFDGQHGTKWCTFKDWRKKSINGRDDVWFVEFQANAPVWPTGYKMTTGNDCEKFNGRNPKAWKLYGKPNIDDEWVLLSEVSNGGMADVNCKTYSYSIGDPSYYMYFRLEISSTVRDATMQISEISLVTIDPDM